MASQEVIPGTRCLSVVPMLAQGDDYRRNFLHFLFLSEVWARRDPNMESAAIIILYSALHGQLFWRATSGDIAGGLVVDFRGG